MFVDKVTFSVQFEPCKKSNVNPLPTNDIIRQLRAVVPVVSSYNN